MKGQLFNALHGACKTTPLYGVFRSWRTDQHSFPAAP